jgi:hypothetical protein
MDESRSGRDEPARERSLLHGAVAGLILLAILAGGFRPYYVAIYADDLPRLSRYLTAFPFRQTPGLREFLEGVAERTPPGARIALWVPMDRWNDGYSYAYYRASYVLADRRVLPLLNERDERQPGSIAGASHVVTWGGAPAIDGFAPVWKHPSGILWRRIE